MGYTPTDFVTTNIVWVDSLTRVEIEELLKINRKLVVLRLKGNMEHLLCSVNDINLPKDLKNSHSTVAFTGGSPTFEALCKNVFGFVIIEGFKHIFENLDSPFFAYLAYMNPKGLASNAPSFVDLRENLKDTIRNNTPLRDRLGRESSARIVKFLFCSAITIALAVYMTVQAAI